MQDLDDVTRFNEAIDEALADSLRFFVSEIDRARNLFLSVLGHDLRTPLSTIVTCAHIISLRRPEEAREAETILRSADRMKALVDVVLSYTRRSLGVSLPIKTASINLEDLVGECVDELRHTNPGRLLNWTSTGDMVGEWDRLRLGQLVSNLVGNALKYGAADRAIEVTLTGTLADEVSLQVLNFGPPILEATLNDIFEPLVRGPGATMSSRGGGANMGLGLYIAREVATAHGGSITATSSVDAGTLFEVHLPRSVA